MSYRREFLRQLAMGTGAILLGHSWYKAGRGVIQPPPEDFVLVRDWGVQHWSSSDPGVLRVHPATGLATAVAPGHAILTCTCEGVISSSDLIRVDPWHLGWVGGSR